MQRLLETACLFALLVIVGLRPLVSESYDSAGDPISNALESIAGPSPLRTLMFDTVIMLAGCGWLLSRALGRAGPMRWTGLEVGTAILLIATVGSCLFAGHKRLAINGAIDWLCYPLLAILLAQLLNTPFRRGLLVAVVLAAAAAQALECAEQRFVSFPETWNEYQHMKADFWAKQGVPADSPKAILFEQRLRSAEAGGFLGHSNVAGSYLVLCGLAAAGLAIARLRTCPPRAAGMAPDLTGATDKSFSMRAALTALLAVAILGATVLTASRGAMASAVIAGILWPVFALLAPRMLRRRRAALIALWIAVVLGVAGVAALARSSAPGSSLHFRWQYWTASARMVADHPIFGVGAENFGRHYTQYKTIDSAEEVANPHNLFVQAATSWGVVGLAGLVALFIGATGAMVRRPRENPSDPSHSSHPSHPSHPSVAAALRWGAALTLTVLALRTLMLGSDEPNYIFYATTTTGLAWLAGLAIAMPGRNESSSTHPAIIFGAAAGIAALLIHDLINFALFVPGAAVTFFAVLGLIVSRRAPATLGSAKGAKSAKSAKGESEPVRSSRLVRWAGFFGATAAAVILFFACVWPVGEADTWMNAAEAHPELRPTLEVDMHRKSLAYEQAARSDPLDPTPLVKLAQWLASASAHPEVGTAGMVRAADLIEQAAARDPYHGSLRRMSAQLHLSIARASGSADEYRRAVESAAKARDLYPTDPQVYLLLGECRLALGLAASDQAQIAEAITCFEEALRLDAARPSWEIIRRLSEKEREAIREKVREAKRG